MAKLNLPADDAGRNPVSAPNILNFKLNGVTPFLSHRDAANDRLSDAHALLIVLARAYDCAQEAMEKDPKLDTIESVPPGLISEALDAVSNLVAYAQYHIDAAGQEARS